MLNHLVLSGILFLLSTNAQGFQQERRILCKIPFGESEFLAAEYVLQDYSIGYTQLCRMNASGAIIARYNVAVNDKISALLLNGDELYVGGNFSAYGDTMDFYYRSAYLAKFDAALLQQDPTFPACSYPVKHLAYDARLGTFLFGQFGAFHTNGGQEVLWIKPDASQQELFIGGLGQIYNTLLFPDELVICGSFFGPNGSVDSTLSVNLQTLQQRGYTRCWKSTHDLTVMAWQNTFLIGGLYRNSDGLLQPEIIQFNPLKADEKPVELLLPEGRFQRMQISGNRLLLTYDLAAQDPLLKESMLVYDLSTHLISDTISLSAVPNALTNLRWLGNEHVYTFEPVRGYTNSAYHYRLGRVALTKETYEQLPLVFDDEVYFVTQSGNELIFAGRFRHVNGLSRGGIAFFDLQTNKLSDRSMNTSQAVSGLWHTKDAIYVGGALVVGGTSCAPLITYSLSTGLVQDKFPLLDGSVEALYRDDQRVHVKGDFIRILSGDPYVNQLLIGSE